MQNLVQGNHSYGSNIFSHVAPKVQMAQLLTEFQNTITKQQITIQFLLKQQQEQQQKLQYLSQFHQGLSANLVKNPEKPPENQLKWYNLKDTLINYSENNLNINNKEFNPPKIDSLSIKKKANDIKSEPSVQTTICSEDSIQKNKLSSDFNENAKGLAYEEDLFREDEAHKIIRRNGFKQTNNESNGTINEKSRPKRGKSKKYSTSEYSTKKGKYIWLNYGRKIVAYALSETTDDGNEKIKEFVGKLNSKADFKEIFGVKPTDSDCKKAFKIMFGKLALYFIHFKADEAFEGSKYKDDMLFKKEAVSSLIQKLIGCCCLRK